MAGEALSGVVLAGGTSSRMGRNKATLTIGGETLLERTVRVVSTVAAEVVVAGTFAAFVTAIPTVIFAPDVQPGLGPLAGLVTGLRFVSNPWAVVVACDCPFLSSGFLAGIAAIDRGNGVDAVVPVVADRPQPLHAVYRAASAAVLSEALSSPTHRERGLRRALTALEVRWVTEPEVRVWDPDLQSFIQVNTPEEWQAAQELALRLPSD